MAGPGPGGYDPNLLKGLRNRNAERLCEGSLQTADVLAEEETSVLAFIVWLFLLRLFLKGIEVVGWGGEAPGTLVQPQKTTQSLSVSVAQGIREE